MGITFDVACHHGLAGLQGFIYSAMLGLDRPRRKARYLPPLLGCDVFVFAKNVSGSVLWKSASLSLTALGVILRQLSAMVV